jgi:hypothetical protein
METDVDVEILKNQDFHINLQNAAGVSHSSHRPGGDQQPIGNSNCR